MGKWGDRKLILLCLLAYGCLVGLADNVKYLPYCGKHCKNKK